MGDYCNASPETIARVKAFESLARTGVKVYHNSKAYELRTYDNQDSLLFCTINDSCIGLFHLNDHGVNAHPDDLFVDVPDANWMTKEERVY